MKRLISSGVILFLAFLPGVSTAAAEAPSAAPETIILISMDTTRADRLSCYGYEHETTPNIDALAKESLFFEHPFAPAPMTLPSHCSMFTGLIPPAHGVHNNTDFNLAPSALTLAEILRQNGYATYGIASTIVLKGDRGVNQGFDKYDDAMDDSSGDAAGGIPGSERYGKETTDRALQWLNANAQKKKFMFIHYFDPHYGYTPPAPFDTRFKDPYDGEIAFTDHCVGRIMDRLKDLDLYDDALIALVGDHGEMLGEHGEKYHFFFIYQNVLRVPMMFRPPGGIPSKKIKEPCSLIDVTPTLLSLAGLAVPEPMQGLDLSSYLKPNFTMPNRAIYAESMSPTTYNCSSLLGIVVDRWHYIQTARPELYDRLKDPVETNNLVMEHPARANEMKERLKSVLIQSEHKEPSASAELDAAAMEQLESLGYLGSNVEVDYSFDVGKEDAKDLIGVVHRVHEADRLAKSGKGDQAVKICTEILQEHPKVKEAHKIMASVYIRRNDLGKAVAVLQQTCTQFPDDWVIVMKLVDAYKLLNRNAEAINALNAFIALKGDVDKSYQLLFDIYMKQKAFGQALATLDRRRVVFPDDVNTLVTRGNVFHDLNDAPNALTCFLDALAIEPTSILALTKTADTFLRMGDLVQALPYLEQALAQDNNLPNVHLMAAQIRLAKKNPKLHNPQLALKHARIAFELSRSRNQGKCENSAVLEILALACAANGNFDEAIAVASEAMELAGLKGSPDQADKMKTRIESYRRLSKRARPSNQ